MRYLALHQCSKFCTNWNFWNFLMWYLHWVPKVIILITRSHYMPWFLGVIAKCLQATKKQLTWKENHILKVLPWIVYLSYHGFWLPICKYACRDNNFLLIFILTKIETWCNNVGKVRISIVGMRKARILPTV